MILLRRIILQIVIGFIFALAISGLGFYGYFAGYAVGAVVMLVGFSLKEF